MKPRIGITAGGSADAARMKRYVDYIAAGGGEPIVLRPVDRVSLAELDGLLLSGGVDVHPRQFGRAIEPATAATLSIDEERDAFELPLARTAIEAAMPVFGICRGFQVLNVVAGGALIQHLDGHRVADRVDAPSGQHVVRVAAASRLAELVGKGEVAVNSRHHQGLREAELAPGLRATAWSPDGLVEGLERRDGGGWLIGVQWHPERVDECAPACRELARRFVEAAAEYADLAGPGSRYV